MKLEKIIAKIMLAGTLAVSPLMTGCEESDSGLIPESGRYTKNEVYHNRIWKSVEKEIYVAVNPVDSKMYVVAEGKAMKVEDGSFEGYQHIWGAANEKITGYFDSPTNGFLQIFDNPFGDEADASYEITKVNDDSTYHLVQTDENQIRVERD
jgi:hypothetical protein